MVKKLDAITIYEIGGIWQHCSKQLALIRTVSGLKDRVFPPL